VRCVLQVEQAPESRVRGGNAGKNRQRRRDTVRGLDVLVGHQFGDIGELPGVREPVASVSGTARLGTGTATSTGSSRRMSLCY
jgi:hypothetical protein